MLLEPAMISASIEGFKTLSAAKIVNLNSSYNNSSTKTFSAAVTIAITLALTGTEASTIT